MKKLAARDFEDLLQVCGLVCLLVTNVNNHCFQDMIPAVENLLAEPYNDMILTLLYRLAEWHALAKLRMHTEHTLEFLETTTATIGQKLRGFRDVSLKDFKCFELPEETAARERREERARARKAQSNRSTVQNARKKAAPSKKAAPPKTKTKAKSKTLNLFTYKFHALGDYVRTIKLFGTTDSYSTQIVSSTLFSAFKH